MADFGLGIVKGSTISQIVEYSNNKLIENETCGIRAFLLDLGGSDDDESVKKA